jgi:2-amino-4-hydroxy-6-hydroxymethyldihydropteridine diphosphokinase
MSAATAGIAHTADLPRWTPAYVGIGSNLDDPRRQVERAFDALAQLPRTRLVLRSALFRTVPFGAVVQPAFVNAAAGLFDAARTEDLLAELRGAERALGREPPRQRWGPRVIDLDLLVMGREVRDTEALKLPHPGIAERDFVLYPLGDIAPDLDVPGLARVRALRARVTDRGIERL